MSMKVLIHPGHSEVEQVELSQLDFQDASSVVIVFTSEHCM